MRRVRPILFASLLVLFAAGAGGQRGCSCGSSPPPPGGAADPGLPPPVRGPGEELPSVRRSSPPPVAVGTPPPTVDSMTLKDPRTGVVLEFETDGQHVSATAPDGSRLWHANPFDTAALKGRESDGKRVWPTVTYAGPPHEWMLQVAARRGHRGEYVALGMNTKEGGLLDLRTGEFLSMGND